MKNKPKKELKKELEKIYQENYVRIYNNIYYKILHKEVAEDLTSIVFFKVIKAYHSFDPDKANVKTWINCITKNTLIDYYRSQKHQNISLEYLDVDHKNLIIDFDKQVRYLYLEESKIEKIKKIFLYLKEHEKELIRLKYYKNKTHLEISKETGIPKGTISSRHFRIIKKMKRILPNLE